MNVETYLLIKVIATGIISVIAIIGYIYHWIKYR